MIVVPWLFHLMWTLWSHELIQPRRLCGSMKPENIRMKGAKWIFATLWGLLNIMRQKDSVQLSVKKERTVFHNWRESQCAWVIDYNIKKHFQFWKSFQKQWNQKTIGYYVLTSYLTIHTHCILHKLWRWYLKYGPQILKRPIRWFINSLVKLLNIQETCVQF